MLSRFHHSKHFRRAAWVAVMAVLLQILVPLIHHPVQVFDGKNLHICGLNNHLPSQPDNEKAPAQKSPACPVCQTLHMLGNGFVTPHAPVITEVYIAANPVYDFTNKPVIPRLISPSARPRAPPTLV